MIVPIKKDEILELKTFSKRIDSKLLATSQSEPIKWLCILAELLGEKCPGSKKKLEHFYMESLKTLRKYKIMLLESSN